MTYGLCDSCRAREAGHAHAALSVLRAETSTTDERTVAAEELEAALALLRLAPGVPRDRERP
jgi:hypothetical protein